MKKVFMLIILIFILSGCNRPKWVHITSDVDDSQFKTIILNAGDKFKLDLSYFEEKYDFEKITFYYDNNIVRVNNKEELLALRLGKTILTATIYGSDYIKSVYIYNIVVVDYTDERMIAINYPYQLREYILKDPSGIFYINNDLDFSIYENFKPIPYFEGVIINPNCHVIKNLNISSNKDCAIFENVTNAFIDGIILEDVNIVGKANSTAYESLYTGGLVGYAYGSYLSNIHISGNVKNGMYVGGIAGFLYKSSLYNSSFVGEVSGGIDVGGLVGFLDNRTFVSPSLTIGVIRNCYVVGDICGGYVNPNKVTPHHLGGLVGRSYQGIIISTYFSGHIYPDELDYHTPLIAGNYGYGFFNVYYASDYSIEDAYASLNFTVKEVYKVTYDELISGNELKGLEDFTFTQGSYPTI